MDRTMAKIVVPILVLVGLAALVAAKQQGSHIYERMTLERPGKECVGHWGYPYTFQCAVTKKCILAAQFKNGTYDCCERDGLAEGQCHDTSDEDRVLVPDCGESTQLPKVMQFQCAKTKRCLNRFSQTANGLCECCGPDKDCATCDDHSDEDACKPYDWYDPQTGKPQKFSCGGKCLRWDKLEDGKLDCENDCVEKDVKEECETKLQLRTEEMHGEWCERLRTKTTPYIRCEVPSPVVGRTVQACLTYTNVRNGKTDCVDGMDEDTAAHPDCTPDEFAAHCGAAAVSCVRVNDAAPVCRCAAGKYDCARGEQDKMSPSRR